MTADRFLLSSFKKFRGTLVIGEASQIPHYIWCQLCSLKHLGEVRFIVLGDISNQMAPVSDVFQGREASFHADSEFLRILTGSHRLTLTKGRRSDLTLFNFYSRLALGGDWHSLPLKAQISLCRERFGKPPPGVRPEVQLCISHKQRQALIRKAQKEDIEARRGQEMIYLPPRHSSCQNKSQELYIWPGKRLISIATVRPIYNSQLLECVALGAATCSFRCVDSGAKLTLSHAAIQRHCRCAAAMTYASVQGRGFHSVGIWTASPRMTAKHLFMALSRSRSSKGVWIMD